MDQHLDTDDALLQQLRADLDEFVGGARLEPPALEHIRRSVPTFTGRRVVLGLAAASIVALVGGLVLLQRRSDVTPTTTPATTAPPATPTTQPFSPSVTLPPFGADLPVPTTPDGWAVVEWGPVRFSVPPDLSPFDTTNGCDVSTEQGDLQIHCPAGSVTVDSPQGTEVVDSKLLNGLEVAITGDGGVFVQAFGTEVVVDRPGASSQEILDTVGVSSRWRFENGPAPAVPTDWVPYELDGIQFMIPPDWPVEQVGPQAPDPDVCGIRAVEPKLLVGRGSLDAPVDCSRAAALFQPSDGVRIFEVETRSPTDNAPGHPYIEVRAFGGSPEHKEYTVRVGFGGDGTVGRTILGSLGVFDVPSTTSVPASGEGQRFEAVATVLENADHGPQLCLGGARTSLPPQCGGPDIVGWSWDAIDGEQSASGTTWGDAYVTGRYDPATDRFTVDGARTPTQADRDSIGDGGSQPDYGVPCSEPADGWPARKQEWPGDQVSAIDGYAGAWTDPSQQVMVVKFTGDLTVAEQAVRTYYSGAVCVIGAEHTEAELRAIQEQLTAMSSIQFLWSAVYADVTGEWVEAGVIAPDPARQAAFDAQWGSGVVRLIPALHPIGG